MKIDSIDIRSFDAKQLTVDFEPPQTGVTVEMFDGALIPSESETYTPLSGLTVTVLFRGKDRDEVQKHVSDFNAELQKGVVLTLDGYSRHFKAWQRQQQSTIWSDIVSHTGEHFGRTLRIQISTLLKSQFRARLTVRPVLLQS